MVRPDYSVRIACPSSFAALKQILLAVHFLGGKEECGFTIQWRRATLVESGDPTDCNPLDEPDFSSVVHCGEERPIRCYTTTSYY